MLDDPLIDWLQLYGNSRDYLLKEELSGYDKDLDFLEFISDKGRQFEAGILRLFQAQYDVTTVAQDYQDTIGCPEHAPMFRKRGVWNMRKRLSFPC